MAIQGDIHLFENTIEDPYVLENFKRLKIFLRDNALFKFGFIYKTFEIPAGLTTNFKFKHNLNFVPKDLITTAVSNNAVLTWHFDTFDKDFVYLDASAPCSVRVLLGSYKDESE